MVVPTGDYFLNVDASTTAAISSYYRWQTTGTDEYVVNNLPVQFEYRYLDAAPRKLRIAYKDGNKRLVIEKDSQDEIEITPQDIQLARVNFIRDARIQIVSKKAETKAEGLLKMFVSEIDFRNYQQKGFFTVKCGDKVFRVWKDNHKWIDVYKSEGGILLPDNRLCVHTAKRELPLADEALAKLMLIRSNKVFESSNAHGVGDLKPLEPELVLA